MNIPFSSITNWDAFPKTEDEAKAALAAALATMSYEEQSQFLRLLTSDNPDA